MKNRDCNTRNHRHGVFPKKPSSRNFRTRIIPYYSIFGIYGMSKTLDSGCSKKKKSYHEKTPPFFFSRKSCFLFILRKRGKNMSKNKTFFPMQKHFHFFRS